MRTDEVKKRLQTVNMRHCSNHTGIGYYRIVYMKIGKFLQFKKGECEKLMEYFEKMDKVNEIIEV